MVIWVSRVYLHFSFRHLSSPDGWSCQTAQTIHHLKATLRKVSALPPLLHQQHFSPSLPVCILFIFSSFLTRLSAQIDFLSHSFGSLVFILPLQATDPYFALPSPPLFTTLPVCSLSLTQLLLTCLHVWDPMHLGGQPLDTMSILILSFPSLPLQWPSVAVLFWRDSLKGSCVWETTELRGNVRAHSFRRRAFAAKRMLRK